MRHVYECPLRWADLDLLGHVNNVIYVDYLQEARIDMLVTHAPDRRADQLGEGVVVVRHEVSYVRPLLFRQEPVKIEVWVSEIRAASFTMAYEVYDETPEGRVVYLRALSLLTPYVFAEERPRRITDADREVLTRFLEPVDKRPRTRLQPARLVEIGHYPLQVRFSDVDVYGHVNNVKYYEYFQEARIRYLSRVWGGVPGEAQGSPPGQLWVPLVVAQVDVDYKVPILFRTEPYDAWTWVSDVGESSFTVEAEIRDGDTVLSQSRIVLVCFDPSVGRAAPIPAEQRDLLVKELTR